MASTGGSKPYTNRHSHGPKPSSEPAPRRNIGSQRRPVIRGPVSPSYSVSPFHLGCSNAGHGNAYARPEPKPPRAPQRPAALSRGTTTRAQQPAAAAGLPLLATEGGTKVAAAQQSHVVAPLRKYDERLFSAIRRGDEKAVGKLLTRGADPNANKLGDTPLNVAIAGNQPNLVRLLLLHGADVNAPGGPKERTPLFNACKAGHENIVKILLDAKEIDIDKQDRTKKHNMTALMTAVAAEHYRIVARLLKHKADPNATSGSGSTPLMYAVILDNEPMVRLLLQYQADPKAEKNGKTITDRARKTGNRNIVELLKRASS